MMRDEETRWCSPRKRDHVLERRKTCQNLAKARIHETRIIGAEEIRKKVKIQREGSKIVKNPNTRVVNSGNHGSENLSKWGNINNF